MDKAKKLTRLQLGHAWMFCSDCMARLYSFDGYEDQCRECPTKQKCEDEKSNH